MKFKDLATWDAFVAAGTCDHGEHLTHGEHPTRVYIKLPPLLVDGVPVHNTVMCLPVGATYASTSLAVVRWDALLCDKNPDTVGVQRVRVRAEVVEVVQPLPGLR